MATISLKQLQSHLDKCGIESTLAIIDIEKIDDHVIKTILRTIEHSIDRLHEELASST